jgi:hypothetical protein
LRQAAFTLLARAGSALQCSNDRGCKRYPRPSRPAFAGVRRQDAGRRCYLFWPYFNSPDVSFFLVTRNNGAIPVLAAQAGPTHILV